jgi:RNA recognition motif-containing protein
MSESSGSSASGGSTLYVNNINVKIKKLGLKFSKHFNYFNYFNYLELKRDLYALFSIYGVVIDIICQKSSKMQGQAFIVFRDPVMAARALKELDGTVFLGRKMVYFLYYIFYVM